MALGSTFPADDVPDRTEQVLEVLRRHDPVPVPVTTLYLAIEDKRALADSFAELEEAGFMERVTLHPADETFAKARVLLESTVETHTEIGAYRLGARGRS